VHISDPNRSTTNGGGDYPCFPDLQTGRNQLRIDYRDFNYTAFVQHCESATTIQQLMEFPKMYRGQQPGGILPRTDAPPPLPSFPYIKRGNAIQNYDLAREPALCSTAIAYSAACANRPWWFDTAHSDVHRIVDQSRLARILSALNSPAMLSCYNKMVQKHDITCDEKHAKMHIATPGNGPTTAIVNDNLAGRLRAYRAHTKLNRSVKQYIDASRVTSANAASSPGIPWKSGVSVRDIGAGDCQFSRAYLGDSVICTDIPTCDADLDVDSDVVYLINSYHHMGLDSFRQYRFSSRVKTIIFVDHFGLDNRELEYLIAQHYWYGVATGQQSYADYLQDMIVMLGSQDQIGLTNYLAELRFGLKSSGDLGARSCVETYDRQ
jgi:hypothetical protein